jgi:hypothetical protein
MKLLGVRLARSIWLAPQQFFNPRGQFLRHASIAAKARYQFLKSPYDNGTAGTGEAKYEGGGFKNKLGVEIAITSLTLHNDGVVVDTQANTDDSDAFLEDVFGWLHQEFELPAISNMPVKRLYASELNVLFDKPPVFLNPKLKGFVDKISAAAGDKKVGDFSFLGFQLGTDPERSPRPAQFRFEREASVPIDSGRYYSFAPTKTDPHVKLLEELEAAL